MTVCLDCGARIPATLDVPLCNPCLRLAIAFCGSGEARVTMLAERAGR